MTCETGGAGEAGSWMTDGAGATSVTGESRFRPQRPHARPVCPASLASHASHASHPSPQCTAIKPPRDSRAHACNHLFIAASVEVWHFTSPHSIVLYKKSSQLYSLAPVIRVFSMHPHHQAIPAKTENFFLNIFLKRMPRKNLIKFLDRINISK